jgi:hypothetical protein
MTAVQYTFTHKQYTQRNETEYTERNIHNNKNNGFYKETSYHGNVE